MAIDIDVDQRSYSTATYPSDIDLSSDEAVIVNSVRFKIGDYKHVEYETITSTAVGIVSQYTGMQNVSADGYTYKLGKKGWPLNVTLDGTSYEALTNPIVNGYRYMTFSGATITATGTLNVWYHSFRFSDREILDAYDHSPYLIESCGITSSSITTPTYVLQACITLLEGEIRELMTQSADIRDGDTVYNVSDVLRERNKDLDGLRKDLAKSLMCTKMAGLQGVRVE